MNSHKNARLTVHGRALLVRRVLDEGLRPVEVAQAMGVSARTVYKWVRRFQEEGHRGLRDRSSRPQRRPHATSSALRQQVLTRRRQRQTYRQIVEVDLSTLDGVSYTQETITNLDGTGGDVSSYYMELTYIECPVK